MITLTSALAWPRVVRVDLIYCMVCAGGAWFAALQVLALEELQSNLYRGQPQASLVGTQEFKFLKIQIYCTDKDPKKIARLKRLAAGNVLKKIINFGRPNLVQSVKRAMADQINSLDAGAGINHGTIYLFWDCDLIRSSAAPAWRSR